MEKPTSNPVGPGKPSLTSTKSSTILPFDPPEGHGLVAGSPLLNNPPRSEREICEGRLAQAELDRAFCPSNFAYGILFALETGSEVTMNATGQVRPGRYVVARDPKYGPAILACWQDATTGTVHFHRQHRDLWTAMEDIARRGRAGCADFLPGFDR